MLYWSPHNAVKGAHPLFYLETAHVPHHTPWWDCSIMNVTLLGTPTSHSQSMDALPQPVLFAPNYQESERKIVHLLSFTNRSSAQEETRSSIAASLIISQRFWQSFSTADNFSPSTIFYLWFFLINFWTASSKSDFKSSSMTNSLDTLKYN